MSITNFVCTRAASGIFDEILSAMGGYAFLQQTLGLVPSFLCRGEKGELIMQFNGFEEANKVKIVTDEIDFYSMTFYKFSFASETRGCQVVGSFEGVGRDQLQHYFEEFTGLSLASKFSSCY